MREANWGRIINIASVHGLVASAQKSAYVAAKHGIVGLTKSVALETATTGVTCNAICPGWVLTPLVQKQVDAAPRATASRQRQAQNELLGEKQPSLQFTTPEQLGGLAVFLCSPAATTGARRGLEHGRRLDCPVRVSKAEALGEFVGLLLEVLDGDVLRLGLGPGALLAAQAEAHVGHGERADAPGHLGDARKVAPFEHQFARALPAVDLAVLAVARRQAEVAGVHVELARLRALLRLGQRGVEGRLQLRLHGCGIGRIARGRQCHAQQILLDLDRAGGGELQHVLRCGHNGVLCQRGAGNGQGQNRGAVTNRRTPAIAEKVGLIGEP
jgi:hypothetical protein